MSPLRNVSGCGWVSRDERVIDEEVDKQSYTHVLSVLFLGCCFGCVLFGFT